MNSRIYLGADSAASDFVFDSELIEFNSGSPRLKNILPEALTARANFNTNLNLSYSRDNGSLVGTGFNGAAVSNGRLILADNQYVRYAGTANANSAIQQGCIEVELRPGYAGSPSNQSVIFSVLKALGDNTNIIRLDHATNGNLVLYMYDMFGSAAVTQNLGVWAPISGTNYIFSLNWSINAGGGNGVRLFINGTQFGSTITTVLTRSSEIDLVQLSYEAPYSWVGQMDNFLIFDEVRHTAAYTPVEVTEYSIANPTIKPTTAIVASHINSIITSATTPTDTAIQSVLEVNGVNKWFDSSAWADSSGYGESNLEWTEEQLDLLDLEGSAEIRKIDYLHSLGAATPILLEYEIEYTGHDFATITGIFLNADGTPANGGIVRVTPTRLTTPTNTNTQVDYATIEYTVEEESGQWIAPDLIIGVTYDFKFYSLLGETLTLKGTRRKVITQTGTQLFNDLVNG